MNIIPSYKNRIISLPSEVVLDKLSTATKDELAVLIALCNDPDIDIKSLSERLSVNESVIENAVDMWIRAGALSVNDRIDENERNSTVKSETEKKKAISHVSIHSALPFYSQEEIAEIVEQKEGCSELLDSCQQTLGKMFNVNETACIIRLLDHLSLPGEFILMLCQFAAEQDKRSVRTVEKMAIDYYDRDIVTCEALEEELQRIMERKSLESFVRNLFGFGSRTLIKKEKDFIASWSNQYHFSHDLVQAAYEETIMKIQKPSIDYTNRILENWYAAGYLTPEDVANASQNQSPAGQPGSSFKTNDFFEAALKRSYSGKKSDNRKGGTK